MWIRHVVQVVSKVVCVEVMGGKAKKVDSKQRAGKEKATCRVVQN